MTTVTLAQICDAIETTLGATVGINRAQSYDELTESVNKADLPLIQVYPENNLGTDTSGTADRSTFRAGVRQKLYTIYADLYAQQRTLIGEDMSAYTTAISALDETMEEQDTKPYFGLDGIKAFSWSWSRQTFIYGDDQLPYVGARIAIIVRVF